MSVRHKLDIERLAEAVTTVLRHRRISARHAAKEIGVSPSTLTRLGQGKKPDVDGLLSILSWLGTDGIQYARPATTQPDLDGPP